MEENNNELQEEIKGFEKDKLLYEIDMERVKRSYTEMMQQRGDEIKQILNNPIPYKTYKKNKYKLFLNRLLNTLGFNEKNIEDRGRNENW